MTDRSLVISLFSNNAGTPDDLAFLLSASDNIAIGGTAIVKAIDCGDTSDKLALLLNYSKNPIKLDEAIGTWGTKASPDQSKMLFNCPKALIRFEERCALYLMSLERAALLGSKDCEYLDLLSVLDRTSGPKN